MFNCRSASGLTPLKIAWTTSDKTYTSAYKSTKPHISNGNTIYFASDYYLNDDCYIPSGTGTSGITWNRIPANNGTCSLVLHLGPRVLIEDSSWTDTYRPDLYEAYVNIKNFISNSTLTVQSTGYNDTNENNWTDKWENISLSIGTTLHCGNNAFQDWTNYSGTCWKRSDFDQQTILEIIVHFPYVHNAGGFNFIRNGKFVFNYRG